MSPIDMIQKEHAPLSEERAARSAKFTARIRKIGAKSCEGCAGDVACPLVAAIRNEPNEYDAQEQALTTCPHAGSDRRFVRSVVTRSLEAPIDADI